MTSPDGTQIVFARDVAGTTKTDVWVVRTDGTDLHKITPAPLDMLIWGAFTPDGRQVALIHQVTGPAHRVRDDDLSRGQARPGRRVRRRNDQDDRDGRRDGLRPVPAA